MMDNHPPAIIAIQSVEHVMDPIEHSVWLAISIVQSQNIKEWSKMNALQDAQLVNMDSTLILPPNISHGANSAILIAKLALTVA